MIGKGIVMYVVVFNLVVIFVEGVFVEFIVKEKEIVEVKVIEFGKFVNIVEKMVIGLVEKYLNEVVFDC